MAEHNVGDDPGDVFVMTWGGPGSGDGQFYSPTEIAVDGDGHVYVADSGNDRIRIFATDGSFVGKRGSEGCDEGEFQAPGDVAADPGEGVYVADMHNDRVQKLTSEGMYLAQWSCPFEPQLLAVGPSRDVYVAERGTHRIRKFASDGSILTQWGAEGSGPGEFGHASPTGIAVDAGGNVYVASAADHEIVKWPSVRL